MSEQQPKRPVSELKPAELRLIIGEIQKLLWWDVDGGREFWNNQKQLSLETLDHVAGVFQDHGLDPINAPTVTGFKSIDDFNRSIAENFSASDEPTSDDHDDTDQSTGGRDAS